MSVEFDLLGDPIPENHGKPGANGHVPNGKTASKIRTLLVSGLPLEAIAKQVGITVPTIRKHYFRNGKVKAREARQRALAEARARNLLRLEEAAAAGNVSAMGKIQSILDAEEKRVADDGVKADAASRKKQPQRPRGKKEADQAAAAEGEAALDDLVGRDQRVH